MTQERQETVPDEVHSCLVAGDVQEVDAELADMDRDLADGLRGIGVSDRAHGVRQLRPGVYSMMAAQNASPSR